MRKYISALLIIFIFKTSFAQDGSTVKVWEESLTLPTYKIDPPDKNPIFYVPNAYQGAKKVIYPYPLMDNLSNTQTNETYTALYLENEYLKVCVLPEIGGRLFYATDKTNGYEMFYRQHVIKPANIGMNGAWISGGIEWCVFHHHRASSYLPVDYRLTENEDGSKTIWIGELEPRHRMQWTIGISLHPGSAAMQVEVNMYNGTPATNSILYWANVATHANEDYQVIFPPSVNTGVYHAKNSFVNWPVSSTIYDNKPYYRDGVDLSWWKNHPQPISIFAHNLQEDFMGGYDYGEKAGTVHFGNHHIIKGAKLWEWGPGDYGSMWDTEILTDTDGPYAELMVGAFSDNQPDYSWIQPYEFKSFKQYWYPVQEIHGFKNANLEGAVNLEKDGKAVFFGFSPVKEINNATITLSGNGKELFQEQISVAPGNPFVHRIQLTEVVQEEDLEIAVSDQEGHELISYQPQIVNLDQELPPTVETPKSPEEIESTEELFFTGLRIRQFHNPSLNPEDYFKEVLKRDPLHSKANLIMGDIALEHGKYKQAANYYRTSLRRPTANYTRPRDAEALFKLGVVLKELGLYQDAKDTLYRASWDHGWHGAAYFQLAELSAYQQQYREALEQVNSALVNNSNNLEALGLKSAILRHLKRPQEAMMTAKAALEIDPLNSLASNELYLAAVACAANNVAELMKNRDQILRDFHENYLELISNYIKAGLWQEALSLTNLATTSENDSLRSYPIIHYYQAYIDNEIGNIQTIQADLNNAAQLSTDYCFPFRFETIPVLEFALEMNPQDAKAWYYLGNILYDHQPERAIEAWQKSIEIDPSLAIAYRNLGWGYRRHMGDNKKAIELYERAISLNSTDPKYYYELDLLYEKENISPARRLELLNSNHEVVKNRDDVLIREIELLLLNKNYDTALKYLEENVFQRQEGEVSLHDLHVDAHLLKGLEFLKKRQVEQALKYFQKADHYPENHKIGRRNNYDRDAQIFYLTGKALMEAGKKSSAKASFEKAAHMEVGNSAMLYYQAKSLEALGDKSEAQNTFRKLGYLGDQMLKNLNQSDFFAKFGEQNTVRENKANAHYLQGLARLGLGKVNEAEELFRSSASMNNSEIWTNVNLHQF